MANMLYIPNVERDGDTLSVSFSEMVAPVSRKFRHLRDAAHDSDGNTPNAPLLLVNGGIVEGLHSKNVVGRWEFQVSTCSTISILYAGLEYDCGEL